MERKKEAIVRYTGRSLFSKQISEACKRRSGAARTAFISASINGRNGSERARGAFTLQTEDSSSDKQSTFFEVPSSYIRSRINVAADPAYCPVGGSIVFKDGRIGL